MKSKKLPTDWKKWPSEVEQDRRANLEFYYSFVRKCPNCTKPYGSESKKEDFSICPECIYKKPEGYFVHKRSKRK